MCIWRRHARNESVGWHVGSITYFYCIELFVGASYRVEHGQGFMMDR